MYEARGSEKRDRKVLLASGTAETSRERSTIKGIAQNGGWDGEEMTGQIAVKHRLEGKQLLYQAGVHTNFPLDI